MGVAADEKDRFLSTFLRCLYTGPLDINHAFFFLSEERTAVRVCENLRKTLTRPFSAYMHLLSPLIFLLSLVLIDQQLLHILEIVKCHYRCNS